MFKNIKNAILNLWDIICDWFIEVIKWFKKHNIYSLDFYKTKKKLKRWFAIFSSSFVATLLIISIVAVTIINSYLGKINQTEKIDVGEISPVTEQKFDKVINIMFFGIDSRDMSEISRSDAIMLITLDQKNNSIKMTSIARDTLVEIDGHGKDKLNHAFAFGWSDTDKISGGAALACKTINSAFDLNVKEYVTANFWALAKIIDHIGGIEIDIPESVRKDMNKNYIPHLQNLGIKCELIKQAGKQKVSGGQAVAFCRVRYVDGGDVGRGRRQREVLQGVFNKVKTLGVDKYPKLVELALKECSTSLTKSQILSIGTWMLQNFSSLKIENLGIPTSDIEKSAMIDGVWYYTYDLEKASEKIHEFILKKPE